jgi:hypothetical protein
VAAKKPKEDSATTYTAQVSEGAYDWLIERFKVKGKWSFAESTRTPKTTALRSYSTSESDVVAHAERFRRVFEWVKGDKVAEKSAQQDYDKQGDGPFLATVPGIVATLLVSALAEIYEQRAPGSWELGEQESEELLERSISRYTAVLETYFRETCSLEDEIRKFHDWLMTIAALDAAEHADEAGLKDEAWDEVFFERLKRNLRDLEFLKAVISSYSNALAQEFIREFDPTHIPLEELRGLIELTEQAGQTTFGLGSSNPDLEMTSEALALLPEVFMPVDHNAYALAQFVAGRSKPTEHREDGYSLLEVKQPRGQKRQIAVKEGLPPGVIEVIRPDDASFALERILNEKNIVKAKTFLAILSCATQDGVVADEFSIMVEDIMRLVFGYERTGPKKTRSDYWHKGVAEVAKYLALDLPGLQIHTQVLLPHEPEPVIANGFLMHRPVIYTRQTLLFDTFTLLASTGADKDLAQHLKKIGLVGFQIGFPRSVLRAFGAIKGAGEANALERVPREVLGLKGTAFWLAYDIAFLRRWPLGKDIDPGKGKLLLKDVLNAIGYTEEATKTGRNTSYKDALKAWLKDIDVLTDLGLLDHPGATIYDYKAGRWYTINSTVEAWTKKRGTKITREKLEDLRIIYEIPAGRKEQLKGPRTKKRSIRQAATRAQAANKARAKASRRAG